MDINTRSQLGSLVLVKAYGSLLLPRPSADATCHSIENKSIN